MNKDQIPKFSALYKSPIGDLFITGTETAVTGISFQNPQLFDTAIPDCLQLCVEQLEEYFSGVRKSFSVALHPRGNDFQLFVWQALQKIPYGKTVSYLDIAQSIGNPKAVRAVGSANSRNKIPIIIPCHRVIGRDGSLVGYAGGIWRKEYLLKLEKAILI